MTSGQATAPSTDPIAGSAVYPRGSRVNEAGHLEIGGCDAVELAREFGTPCYVYAPDDIRARARQFTAALSDRDADGEVLFASKAAPVTAIYAIAREEGLSVDVASGGELHTALRAGFDPERVYMHGNNKSEAELAFAFESRVGCIVVDSLDEVARADALLAERGGGQDVLIRLTPGIKPSTHSYVQTGQVDSKFGFGLADGQAAEAVAAVESAANLRLAGFHAHIGSQIFELEPYVRAIEALAEFAASMRPRLLNVGGGLGIAYTSGDEPPSIDEYVGVKVDGVRRLFGDVPRILIEPGRSLVGNAGGPCTRWGPRRRSRASAPTWPSTAHVRQPAADALRLPLRGADRRPRRRCRGQPGDDCRQALRVRGRTGHIAPPEPGDILVTPSTGAYGYAMANNYNGIPRPPVIFCSGGDARVVVRRETYEDLTARDVTDD